MTGQRWMCRNLGETKTGPTWHFSNSSAHIKHLGACQNAHLGVPVVAQWLTNPTRNHEVAGSIPGLTQWAKDLVLP